jgi:hypothetical protein
METRHEKNGQTRQEDCRSRHLSLRLMSFAYDDL